MTSDVLEAQFDAVDAVSLKKPFSEVFILLQTKAIDGQENTYSNIYSQKFFEVQPYITESNHGVLDYMVVSSARFWNGLPDDVRGEVKSALDEAIVYGNQLSKPRTWRPSRPSSIPARARSLRSTMPSVSSGSTP